MTPTLLSSLKTKCVYNTILSNTLHVDCPVQMHTLNMHDYRETHVQINIHEY